MHIIYILPVIGVFEFCNKCVTYDYSTVLLIFTLWRPDLNSQVMPKSPWLRRLESIEDSCTVFTLTTIDKKQH